MKILALVFVMLARGVAASQEGATAMPNNYKVQFENAWVKVTTVRCFPSVEGLHHYLNAVDRGLSPLR